MRTIENITSLVKGNETNWYKSSYTMVDDKLVRVSNHLPNVSNFKNMNEDCEKIFLIFVESELSEREIQKFIDSEMKSFEVEFLLLNEENDFSDEMIQLFINRF